MPDTNVSGAKAAYTPGPWRYLPHDGDGIIRGPKPGDGSGVLIAVMGEHDKSPGDAWLIAAAPEMLEALEAIATAQGHVSIMNGVAYFEDGVSVNLYDLIRKAKGEGR